MIGKTTSTLAPKKALIKHILLSFADEYVRAYFQIGKAADLGKRLESKSKPELVNFLSQSENGMKLLEDLEQSYPMHAPPTLYLAHIHHKPEYHELLDTTQALTQKGRPGSLFLKPDSKVRAVYSSRQAHRITIKNGIDTRAMEIPVFYELRLEYSESDPEATDFGERKAIYSLEQGFIWLLDGHTHAIICCQGFAPVRPILDFARQFLQFRWALPNLTSEMMEQITRESKPRSATYSSLDWEMETAEKHLDEFDVRTVTLSDPHLSERNIYQLISGDSKRQQTAGFYSNLPIFTFGGLGIARRYARVWTPAHVSKQNYLSLAINLVERTERELRQTYDSNPVGYIHYYQDYEIKVGNRKLYGRERDSFYRLTHAILEASRNGWKIQIDDNLLQDLVELQRSLGLITSASLDCPNCGEWLVFCPECHLPYFATVVEEDIVLKCPRSKCNRIADPEEGLLCDCGQEVDYLAAQNHLLIYPRPELLLALWDFFSVMDDVTWKDAFCLTGNMLNLVSTTPVLGANIVSLGELVLWQNRARHHVRPITDKTRQKIIPILNRAREKCNINNWHPKQADCIDCLESQMTYENLKQGMLCLPRILGLAISKEKEFDGIHHGHEIADIKYEDNLAGSGVPVKIGIHLKSRTSPAKKGLGQSVECIKALYAQLIYSAYLARTNKVDFGILGVSVPNTIHNKVINSMKMAVNQLGFPLLVLDEDEWVKIVDASLEHLAFA